MRFLAAALCATFSMFAAAAQASLSTVSLFSPSNDRNISFHVYTPPGYAADPSRLYPLVISLHGIGGNPAQRANLYAPTLDARIGSGEILPMIWVFPDGQMNSFYGDAFDGHKQVYSNIIGEVLPYVDANYRTIDGRDYHAMEGFSMGGFGAVLYAAKHPELFSSVVEYGGALATWQNLVQFIRPVAEEMYDVVEANFLPYSTWDVTRANAATLRNQVAFKMIVGDEDSQEQGNIRFSDHLHDLGIDPHFQVLPGTEHQGGAYLSEGSGLRFLSEHFDSAFQRHSDYNRDGNINLRDYDVWRAAFGSTTQLEADGNRNGVVDAADFVLWRAKVSHATFSDTRTVPTLSDGSVGCLSVPEPGNFIGAIIGMLGLIGALAKDQRCTALIVSSR